jgi:hypothetical protein
LERWNFISGRCRRPAWSGSVSSVARMTIRVASTWSTMPARRAAIGGAGVAGHHVFHAGADQRRLGAQQRHGLTLHVRAHQRAVGVVVLEERDQRRGDRHELLRRHVHEVDLVGRRHHEVAALRQTPGRR